MFKTMDGVSVYDKSEVDDITNAISADVSQNTSDITNLKTGVNALQNNKADKSEITPLVQSEVNDIIDTKVSEIAGTFENAIDGKVAATVTSEIGTTLASYDTGAQVSSKIDTALAGYDDSNTVDSKINTAIANIPAGPTAMTTTEATALINQYF